jgi:D-amino peptidase
LIAVDMEGTSGLTTWDQVTPGHAEYQRFRKIMTADVNAAIRGAAEAGVEEIIVTDGHWNGDNLLIEELDPRARLNTGSPSPFSMVEGVQNGVDAVFFVGYHARIGTPNAILDHTWSSMRVMNLWINDRISGEVGLNASLCAHFNAPVILVTGDQAVAAEAQEWLPGVETALTKTAHGRWSAEVLPLAVSQEGIFRAAGQAVRRFQQGDFPKLVLQPQPVKVLVEFFYADMADKAALLPTGKRVDGRSIEILALDMPAAYQAFRAAVTLAQR